MVKCYMSKNINFFENIFYEYFCNNIESETIYTVSLSMFSMNSHRTNDSNKCKVSQTSDTAANSFIKYYKDYL